ncbi:hypothetical protein WJX81_001721 [Elliptochloris bilobata]|uniref:pyruvate decarboxylase n=1 Tax=Elliptochloris bilobata TaxID=381761 RepID=A0AAW1RCC6_9CHLO
MSVERSYQATGGSVVGDRTLGQHLASRLVELGVTEFFAVPGDFNLVLLDQMIKEPKLRMINTCNELNAGYAADGYARERGIACCVVTYTVGGLSLLNAIAGANSENLPVICITGGINSNDKGTNHILHHTIGRFDNPDQEIEAFRPFVCYAVQIFSLEDAHEQIDHAIATAVREQKPCYINICCNLAGMAHPSFATIPVPFSITPRHTNARSLEAAVAAAAAFLNKAVKPVLVGGVKLRAAHAKPQFKELADASRYAVAIMPNAKGFFPESYKRFIGIYWGQVSTPFCAETVEASDAYLFAGPIFNDYTSVGYSLLLKEEKMIKVDVSRVTIGGRQSYGCIAMPDFLSALAKAIKPNETCFENYQRMFIPMGERPKAAPNSALQTHTLFKHVQSLLTPEHAVVAETGDSWFNCLKLKLPDGCGFEFQCQYGSIGWSVGATLGYAIALAGKQRVVACIGDGSFQLTAQDVATMIRYGQNPIIFLINNGGYTIEVEIHDGPYNVIKNWDYVGLVKALHNGEGKLFAIQAKTEEELVAALQEAEQHPDSVVFIEVVTHKDDCSRELLEWGSRVATANSRPPNPQ